MSAAAADYIVRLPTGETLRPRSLQGLRALASSGQLTPDMHIAAPGTGFFPARDFPEIWAGLPTLESVARGEPIPAPRMPPRAATAVPGTWQPEQAPIVVRVRRAPSRFVLILAAGFLSSVLTAAFLVVGLTWWPKAAPKEPPPPVVAPQRVIAPPPVDPPKPEAAKAAVEQRLELPLNFGVNNNPNGTYFEKDDRFTKERFASLGFSFKECKLAFAFNVESNKRVGELMMFGLRKTQRFDHEWEETPRIIVLADNDRVIDMNCLHWFHDGKEFLYAPIDLKGFNRMTTAKKLEVRIGDDDFTLGDFAPKSCREFLFRYGEAENRR